MRKHMVVVLGVVLLVGITAGNVWARTAYVITKLEVLDNIGDSQAYGINNIGQVVGYWLEWSVLSSSAILWEDGAVVDLGRFGNANTNATAINELGQIVGHSFSTDYVDGGIRGFIWEEGVMTDLGDLGGSSCRVTGINDRGQVVGRSSDHPFLWENGVMTDLGDLGPSGTWGGAFCINNSGQVVGRAKTVGNYYLHAFLITPEDRNGDGVADTWFRDDDLDGINDMMRDLGTLVDRDSEAWGINDFGQVVGVGGGGGCLWEDGVAKDLGEIFAVSINDSGQIVGNREYYNHGVIWEDGVMTELIDLLPSNHGWSNLGRPRKINDFGWIVGRGINNGFARGFIMAPVLTHTPRDVTQGDVDSIRFIFGNSMDDTSFSVEDDILSFTGPEGPLTATGYSWLDSRTLDVTFEPQIVQGVYTLELAPTILDSEGLLLDLDGDLVFGETPDDVYYASFKIDTTHPRIVHHIPNGDIAGTVGHIEVLFSETIESRTFWVTQSDVRIMGPNSVEITPSSITSISDSRFQISFAPQSDLGEYIVEMGPDVADFAGNLLDQDRNGMGGEDPNDVYQATFNLVDVDLTLSNVMADPNILWAGEEFTVSWNGSNQSGMPLLGEWTDAVYLSADDKWDIDDKLIATVTHTGGLAQDEVYSQSITEPVPGTLPGDYYIIVRADLYNEEKEGADEGNNIVAIGPFALGVRQLSTDGTPVSGTLAEADRSDYYMVHVEQGEYFEAVLDGLEASASAELFVTYEAIPTRMKYDYHSATGVGGNLQVVIPSGPGGNYYILVYGHQLDGSSSYDLTAAVSELIITEISPDHHGVGSACTMTITGGGFDSNTAVEFIGSDSSMWTPTESRLLSPTTMVVTLDLPSWPVDVYDVVVSKTGVDPYGISDAFEVTTGVAHLETHLVVPSRMGRTWRQTIWIEYANNGDSSMPSPLLKLDGTADEAMLTLDPSLPGLRTATPPPGVRDTIQIMATGSGATPGILQPGDSGRIPVYFLGLKEPWDWSDWTIEFELGVLTADEAEPIDWSSLKNDMQPEWMASDAWDAIWENLTAQIGSTWGDYVQMLDDNMNYLYTIGQEVIDVGSLLAFEIEQAAGLSPYRALSTTVDIRSRTPGILLIFRRIYGQSINSRYELGTLGRGWKHNWDVYVNVLSDGDVVVHDSTGNNRYFYRGENNSYISSLGDYSTLTISNGKYRLKEKNGTVWQFRSDNLLDYVEDINGNRITASYSAGRLSSIIHTNGDQLLLDYNGDGRIWYVTDPRGAGPEDDYVVTYEYDVSGEHLVRVTEPGNRVTSYTYETGSGLQREHALLSVQRPDGRHNYFSYDAQGRLIETHKDGGADSTTYTYDSAGTVTIEEATGRQATLCFGPAGRVTRIRDGEGNIISMKYDSNYQLAKLTGGSGQNYNYSYDERGNLVKTDDPLHYVTSFTYKPTFNRLASATDARGNGMWYNYDASGNLISITYQDGTSESFTYDNSGNVLTWTNRRSDTVTYTYNTAGQVTTKDYPNTPDFNDYVYVYNEAGNLISAEDPCGTTTLTYDPNTDWMKRIDYPSSYFFTFEYDDAGRRTQRTDQNDNEVKYTYDSVGRLNQMTDGNDVLIVDYDYDTAGRLILKTLGNGVYTMYEYDAAGRLTHLVNYDPDDTVISRFDYTYDASGRRTSMTALDGTYTYGYDPLGQLISVTYPDSRVVTYSYDPVGNRIEVVDDGVPAAYTTNSMNQYVDINGVTYTYDPDGNRKSKTEGGITTTYTYDIENRLIGVSNPSDTWTYRYDALGNRVASTHNGVTTYYVVDPLGFGNVVAEYDSNDVAIVRYEYGYGLVLLTDNAGLPAYYTFDAIGSTSELSDANGLVVSSYVYGSFGNLVRESETISNPFGFIGERGVMLDENGLHFMRLRFYDASIGRFIVKDPIGLSSGEVNLYSYVRNDPVNYIDPLGLYSFQQGLSDFSAYAGVVAVGCATAALASAPAALTGAGALAPGSAALGAVVFGALSLGADLLGTMLYSDDPYNDYAKAGLDLFNPLRPPFDIFPLGDWAESASQLLGSNWDNVTGWFQNAWGNIPRPARDPNKKIGPKGAGQANFVLSNGTLAYQIQFENMSDAGSPAHKIVITDTLDEDLDLSTFELTEIVFANHTIVVPEGLSYYETSLDIVVDNEFVSDAALRVEIEASLDTDTGELTCTLMGIDPNTGWMPEDIMLGVLYPNDANGRGDGHISFNVKPLAGLPSGTEITNKASIKFDWNDPIETPLVLNTLDTAPPVSEVNSLPPEANDIYITISWSGQDEPNGSDIAGYIIYVSDNNSVYEVWLDGTTETSTTFIGEHGHTYSFYIVATDNAGHVEDTPISADATITLYDRTAPRIVTAIVNDGQSQRSTIGMLRVQFSEDLVVDKDILTLYNDTNDAPVNLSVLTASDFSYDANTYTATWDLSPVTIEDGNHTATILASAIIDTGGNYLDGDGDGIGGDDYTFDLFCLFGDFDGSRDVDFVDFSAFADKWQKTDCVEPYWCGGADNEPDGDVDSADLAIFVDRWLKGVEQ